MPFESPISVLYDSFGTEIAVSQSQIVSASATPGLMVAASSSNGGAVFFRAAADGALFVTGNLVTTAVATQSVYVAGWDTNVTASVKMDQWSANVTASVKVDQWSANVTASAKIDQWSANVTASVKMDAWATTVTASVREIGAATTLVSAANGSTTNFALLPVNPARVRAIFYKEGASICYVKLGTTATATSYTVAMGGSSYYETPDNYTGRVDIVFSAGTGVLRVTEVTVP